MFRQNLLKWIVPVCLVGIFGCELDVLDDFETEREKYKGAAISTTQFLSVASAFFGDSVRLLADDSEESGKSDGLRPGVLDKVVEALQIELAGIAKTDCVTVEKDGLKAYEITFDNCECGALGTRLGGKVDTEINVGTSGVLLTIVVNELTINGEGVSGTIEVTVNGRDKVLNFSLEDAKPPKYTGEIPEVPAVNPVIDFVGTVKFEEGYRIISGTGTGLVGSIDDDPGPALGSTGYGLEINKKEFRSDEADPEPISFENLKLSELDIIPQAGDMAFGGATLLFSEKTKTAGEAFLTYQGKGGEQKEEGSSGPIF